MGDVAKHLDTMAEPVLEAMRAGVGHDTGQLAAALGVAVRTVGHGLDTRAEALVGVRADANTRREGGITNSGLLVIGEYGDGVVPARHVSSQALNAARP